MITLIDKVSLFNTFNIKDFLSLEGAVDQMAPSTVEYHLFDLSNNCEDSYLNKREIEHSIFIGDFSLYLDYDKNIYLEIDSDLINNQQTGSFW